MKTSLEKKKKMNKPSFDPQVGGRCHLEMDGLRELMIENYKCLLRFQPDQIVVLAGKHKIAVSGRHLQIQYFARETMKVSGTIQTIHFSSQDMRDFE